MWFGRVPDINVFFIWKASLTSIKMKKEENKVEMVFYITLDLYLDGNPFLALRFTKEMKI